MYRISLSALTTRKLKTKCESDKAFRVQQSILFLHFSLSSFYFFPIFTSPLPQFPHFHFQNVVTMHVFSKLL